MHNKNLKQNAHYIVKKGNGSDICKQNKPHERDNPKGQTNEMKRKFISFRVMINKGNLK